MFKLLLKIALFVAFSYMLIAPFIKPEQASEQKPVTSHTKPKIVGARHNVDLPDFKSIKDVPSKKRAFFSLLKPHIAAKNKVMRKERGLINKAIAALEASQTIDESLALDVSKLFEYYKIEGDINASSLQEALLKIDVIPAELVLIQAANESGWGTSRFARLGLNFFGIWCYKPGCGFVPKLRDDEARHEVAAFESIDRAVGAYFYAINTHSAYEQLRELRQETRGKDSFIIAQHLILGLTRYSERGLDYVEELNQMLISNKRYLNE